MTEIENLKHFHRHFHCSPQPQASSSSTDLAVPDSSVMKQEGWNVSLSRLALAGVEEVSQRDFYH